MEKDNFLGGKEDDEKFIKGFNDGYILAEHDPKLLDSLFSNNQYETLPYFNGLLKGKKQFAIEKQLEIASEAREKLKKKRKGYEL